MSQDDEPEAYVAGYIDFLGYRIDLSLRPLIPSPETEFWVERAIDNVKHSVFNKCLDIFSGSGCIGVSVLKNTSATVDFVDIDDNALKQIEINCKLNNIDQSRYRIIKSNIFEKIKESYDYILANPPYVIEDKLDRVQESVLKYEPHIALFGGPDGLKYIKEFLKEAPLHLNPSGKIYMEFDELQKEKLEKMYPNAKFHQDQFRHWRYLVLEKP